MPIDPRIALGVRPGPQPIMPSELEQRRLTLADLGRREKLDQQQAQMNDMRIAEGQQQQAERQATLERAGKVRAVLEKHGGDPEKALPELWSIDPAAADRFDTHLYERKKRGFEMKKAELEQAGTRAKRLGEIAGTATDQATFQRAIGMAVAEKLLPPEVAAQLGDTWDENAKAAVAQFRGQALDVAKQLDEARKNEEQGWKKAESDRKAAADKRAAELHAATLPSKKADPKTGLTPMQAATVEGQRSARGETARHNKAMEAKGSGGDKSNELSQLADAVIQNPSEFDRLTPTTRASLLPILTKRGFTQFGKPMSDSAISKLNEFQAAILEVEQLRKDIAANPEMVGPIAGLQALNPWSKSRELQAKVDLVRQRVGKAIEGGVLRKEDEEKYKKILATLRDTPQTADAKLDTLITSLNRHLENFVSLQKVGGRRTENAPNNNDPLGVR